MFVCVVDLVDSNPVYTDNCSTVVNVVPPRQTVTVYPPSVGAQTGEQNVVLGCNVTGLSTDYIRWTYYPSWQSTGIVIYSTYDNVNKDPSNFTINAMPIVNDTQSVEVIINRLKPELAAQYKCELTPQFGFEKYINVIALDPLECPSGVIEYDEYDVANISCSVNFYDSTLQNPPIIMWYRDGLEVSGVEIIIESDTRRTIPRQRLRHLPNSHHHFRIACYHWVGSPLVQASHADFLPFPQKLEVVSHPVKQWKTAWGNAKHLPGPRALSSLWTAINRTANTENGSKVSVFIETFVEIVKRLKKDAARITSVSTVLMEILFKIFKEAFEQ